MLTYTATATQHVTHYGQTVNRYQALPQNTGAGWEVADLLEGTVVGEPKRYEHQARSLATEYNYT